MNDTAMITQSAFSGILVPRAESGLMATERTGLGIASLSVRRGRRGALQDRVATYVGLPLPDGARRVTAGHTAVAGIGPGIWLFTRAAGGSAFITELKSAVGDTASVADQSDAYAILQLSGHQLRETLAKLVPLDLHPRAFKVGDVAATLAGQIGALLWRLEDGADGQAGFELAVPRSMAASLWHELTHYSP